MIQKKELSAKEHAKEEKRARSDRRKLLFIHARATIVSMGFSLSHFISCSIKENIAIDIDI